MREGIIPGTFNNNLDLIDIAINDRATKESLTDALVNIVYPVGSIFLSINDINPQTYFVGTTWEKIDGGYTLQSVDDNHEAGTYVNAGLPNIEGQFDGNTDDSNQKSGAFYKKNTSATGANGNGDGDSGGYIGFDASRYNSIYGSSDTVQPPAFICYMWKRTA